MLYYSIALTDCTRSRHMNFWIFHVDVLGKTPNITATVSLLPMPARRSAEPSLRQRV